MIVILKLFCLSNQFQFYLYIINLFIQNLKYLIYYKVNFYHSNLFKNSERNKI
jgi:hypothetical protein